MYRSSSSHKVNSALHLLGYVSKMSRTDGGLAGLLQLYSTWGRTWYHLSLLCNELQQCVCWFKLIRVLFMKISSQDQDLIEVNRRTQLAAAVEFISMSN